MDIENQLTDEIKKSVAERVSHFRATLPSLEADRYEQFKEQVLSDFTSFYALDYEQLDIYGTQEIFTPDKNQHILSVPEAIRNAMGKGQIKVIRIAYPIKLTCGSPAVLNLVQESSSGELEVTRDTLAVYLLLGSKDVDEVDFKPAVAATKRFKENLMVLKEDLETLVGDAKRHLEESLDQYIADLRVGIERPGDTPKI